MPSSEGRQRALCILGMHRSGTSAITRSFNLLGAFVGEDVDLMPAVADNPLGYWERNDIYLFHERLLAAARRRWDTGLTLPDGWQHSPEIAPFREELKCLVGAVFAGRPLWAWKDPRTCILLDLWKDVLGGLHTDLDAVLVLRHPLEVAASLGRRNGFGLEKACGIWLGHTLAALRSLEGVRTAFIWYDRYLEDPVGEVQRCAGILGLTRPTGADVTSAAIRGFVRKDLRHNLAVADDLAPVPAPVRDVYELTRAVTGKPEVVDGAFFSKVAEVYRTHSSYAGFFREDLEQCLAVAAGVDAAEARCRESDLRACAAEQRLAEAGLKVAESELKACEAARRALAAELRASESQRRVLVAEELARDHDRRREEAARACEEIVTSKIWRITKPLRTVADALRRTVRPVEPPEN